jgi:hypothetical protein
MISHKDIAFLDEYLRTYKNPIFERIESKLLRGIALAEYEKNRIIMLREHSPNLIDNLERFKQRYISVLIFILSIAEVSPGLVALSDNEMAVAEILRGFLNFFRRNGFLTTKQNRYFNKLHNDILNLSKYFHLYSMYAKRDEEKIEKLAIKEVEFFIRKELRAPMVSFEEKPPQRKATVTPKKFNFIKK